MSRRTEQMQAKANKPKPLFTVITIEFPEQDGLIIDVVNDKLVKGKTLERKIAALQREHPDRSVWTTSECKKFVMANPSAQDLKVTHLTKLKMNAKVIGATRPEKKPEPKSASKKAEPKKLF